MRDKLAAFFEELPSAVASYSIAIGSLALAAILVRAAIAIYA